MKAVIIAGGKGTRMKDLSVEIPKAMLQIGNIPVLQHQVELFGKYGINEIIIIVNHLKDSIKNHFGEGKKFNVKIKYFEEENPLGTVGGLKEIEKELIEDFFVIYGDVMVNMDLSLFKKFHKENKSECSIVLHPNDHPYDSDLVETNAQGRIVAFHSKPHKENKYYRNLVNAGAYIFNPKVLNFIEKGKKADFGKDIFPVVFKEMNMFGYDTAEYLKDIGTPERIVQVNKDFETGKIERANYEYKKKAIFIDRDGVINKEHHLVCKPEDFVLFDYTADAIKQINKSEYLSIVVTNQSVVARNLCTIEEVEYIHKKLETEIGVSGAKIDHIYFCPHHPDKGFPEENSAYKIDCECRKPKPGMLFSAQKDYNIDLSKSFFIGDDERDIICGKNAGVTTVGVMTGKGLRKTKVIPDYFFLNLREAVDFIVREPYAVFIDKIYSQIQSAKKSPFVILIGGNARSGKTSFATYLKKKLNEKNISVQSLSLDNWLVDEDVRKECKDVYQRFDLNKVVKDVQSFFNHEEIKINTYNRHPLQERQMLSHKFQKEQVIIIEGVIALSNERLRVLADLKIFNTIEDELMKKRIFELYRWKGYDDETIENLYQQRKADEYDLVKKDIDFADLIINI